MLAKAVRELPEGPEWEYEVKWDGYRIEAVKRGNQTRLYSRRGNDFTKRFCDHREGCFQNRSLRCHLGRLRTK